MNMKWKQILLIVGVSVVSAIGSLALFQKFSNKGIGRTQQLEDGKLPLNYAGFFENGNGSGVQVDFTKAADAAVPAVVHIKTKIAAKRVDNNLPNNRRQMDIFDQFFGDGFFGPQIQPEQRASGSGVLISDDGYIVTNNHVVAGDKSGSGIADEITVTVNPSRKTYKAKVIGTDPGSDLAVLKIDATNLPYMIYGNSDNVKLGQWVLAIGYPFSLETTVTAGIVSAKGRAIGINSRQSQTPVESFIQTDAAVNQGNSGGALIGTDGQLLGINSAIYAPNGTYAGYSFAIPVNIVKKIVSDIIEYGSVKKGFIGIQYSSDEATNERLVKQKGLNNGTGIYVSSVPSDGAAAKAGIKKGDVITKINGISVKSGLELTGQIATSSPGEKVNLTIFRDGKEKEYAVTLNESSGKMVELNTKDAIEENLGIEVADADAKSLSGYNFDGGVVVKQISANSPLSKTRMEKGFVITAVNNRTVKNIEDFGKVLANLQSSTIVLKGVYPGFRGVSTYEVSLEPEEY